MDFTSNVLFRINSQPSVSFLVCQGHLFNIVILCLIRVECVLVWGEAEQDGATLNYPGWFYFVLSEVIFEPTLPPLI